MEQCIADLNTVVRKADLIVADAMTILTSKGPFGPDDIAKPDKVVAGFDRVALDSYGATLLGLEGRKFMMIQCNNAKGGACLTPPVRLTPRLPGRPAPAACRGRRCRAPG